MIENYWLKRNIIKVINFKATRNSLTPVWWEKKVRENKIRIY